MPLTHTLSPRWERALTGGYVGWFCASFSPGEEPLRKRTGGSKRALLKRGPSPYPRRGQARLASAGEVSLEPPLDNQTSYLDSIARLTTMARTVVPTGYW
jgi:hypothetical protein